MSNDREVEHPVAHQETPHPEPHLDEWHQHTAEEGLPQQEHAAHINIGAMMIVFVAMVVTIIVMVVGLAMFYEKTAAQMKAGRLETTVEWSDEYVPFRNAALENISSYRAIDAEAGVVQVPVDRAIDAVIASYGNAPAETTTE